MAGREQAGPAREKGAAKVSETPASGIRVATPMVLPKLWEEDINTEVSSTTALIPAATRRAGRPRLTIMTGLGAGRVIRLDDKEQYVVGRTRQSDVYIDDPGVSRAHCKLVLREDRFFVQDLRSRNGTLLNGAQVICAPLRTGDRVQLGPNTVLQFNILDETEEALARNLYEASTRDSLTSVYNRRYFTQRLEVEVAHANRHGSRLGVLLFDLDHFKAVNDRFGHPAGDALLRGVANLIASRVRVEDLFARFGGEEFAMLVRDTPREDAALFAERLRARVEALSVPFSGVALRVTVSIGLAALSECGHNASKEAILSLADARLYRAKNLGRNRVCAK